LTRGDPHAFDPAFKGSAFKGSELLLPAFKGSELLLQAEGFTGFSTVDGNVRYQQNIAASGVAIIVLEATTNRMSDVP
jgi:hypothetical protein